MYKSGVPAAGLGRKQIDEIILEASKGSKFYYFQQRREARIAAKVAALTQKRQSLSPAQVERARTETERYLREVEAERDLTQTCVHIDMDAFFASVETLKRPELANKPMAVGGDSMLSTANYEARKYGVVSAMPGYIAKKLCPQLIILPPNYSAYRAASEKARAIMREYDPASSSYSLDEASLDLTDFLRRTGRDASSTVAELRRRVYEATQLTCSAGIAPNRQLAKLCSNLHKPNGQFHLPSDKETILSFIRAQKADKICGVGRVTAKILADLLGTVTCADLIADAHWVRLLFSEIQADFLLRSALGLGLAFGEGDGEEGRKSMSVERTFKRIDSLTEMLEVLRKLCGHLAEDLAGEELVGKTIGIKMKTSAFDVATRAVTLDAFVSSAADLYRHAERLLVKNKPSDLRLLGVRLSGLAHADEVDLTRYRALDEFVKDAAVQEKPVCPVCLEAIDAHPDDDRRINQHIDKCLPPSSQQRLKEEARARAKRPKTLDDYFGKK